MERLAVHSIQDIIFRLRSKQSERGIARDVGHSRITIHRYRELAERKGYLDPGAVLPDPAQLEVEFSLPCGRPSVASSVEPYREMVEGLRANDVEMAAIHQRLIESHRYPGSYSAVRRFVHRIEPAQPRIVVRVETPPGQQAQVDFGSVGRLRDPRSGGMRVSYCFVMTLSYSRHQYVEFVTEQTIPVWIGCHNRAFAFFGGVVAEVHVDNLKAAVLHHDLEDPVLSLPYSRMAQHYGFLIHPCRPRTPEHKGKVENGVHYVQRNFMAGRQFTDIEQANREVPRWVMEVAGVREHGTTHQAPLARFTQQEEPALQALPAQPFELLVVRRAKVHADCHVVLQGSYYSAPHTYVGKELEGYIWQNTVQLFDGVTLLRTHERALHPGERKTSLDDYPPEKAIYLLLTRDVCRERAEKVGPGCLQVVDALLAERPADHLRAIQALVRQEEKVGAERLEAACLRALQFGDPRYRRVKGILAAGLDTEAPADAAMTCATTSAWTALASAARPYAFTRPAADFFDVPADPAARSMGVEEAVPVTAW
jgi:transposase